MKIFKKPLWFTVITTLCLVVVSLFAASGCDKTEIQPKHYTVNFVGEEVGIEAQSITHGDYAKEPKNPEREGYDFGGWFTDNGTFVNEWNFKTDIVTQDTTLYAKWEENTLQEINLQGTKWKLIGIVDTQTDILKELEPKDCEECYSFTFDTDSTATGKSTSNILGVTLKPLVRIFLMTEAGGTDFYLEDAILFRNAIETIISYERNKNELKFYYNDGKNYLKLKKIGG